MKFIHLSDLHLGKRLNEYSLIEDQEYILKSILKIIDDEKPDGVLIAGDVYDKSIPSAEAVMLFDSFLTSLAERSLHVFVISGNHDSMERLSFGSRLMENSGIHISRCYDGNIEPVTLTDGYGRVNVYLLPFVKPSQVRVTLKNDELNSYTEALQAAVEQMNVDTSERNLLITHQFVTGSERSESEDISVGGTDNVDASVFSDFDYVALGHLHKPQNCGSNRIRYCGTPLKYSFSEARDEKSVTVLTMGEKGVNDVRTVPLTPMRDMHEIKGTYEELTARSFYDGTTYRDDYMRITLTDEEDVPDAIGKLRVIYRNLMRLDYDNKRTQSISDVSGTADTERKTPLQIFSELYELQNNAPMTEEQTDFLDKIINTVWEEENEGSN
jgi:exonuclease SbcD